MSHVPETYHITGDSEGLASRETNIFGQYDLVTTSYRSVNVLLYKKNTTEYETVFWMFNISESGAWIVGYEQQEIVMAGRNYGHGLHAPSSGWKLPIMTNDNTHHLFLDPSLTVRADMGKFQTLKFLINSVHLVYIFKIASGVHGVCQNAAKIAVEDTRTLPVMSSRKPSSMENVPGPPGGWSIAMRCCVLNKSSSSAPSR